MKFTFPNGLLVGAIGGALLTIAIETTLNAPEGKAKVENRDQLELDALNMEMFRLNLSPEQMTEMRKRPAEFEEWARKRKLIEDRIKEINENHRWSNDCGAFGPNPSKEVVDAFMLHQRKPRSK